jgi:mannose-6-phosphate isomerase-like protein (cupin superfamily)
MKYLSKVDFKAFDQSAPDERISQPLLDEKSGATKCSVNCIKTPAGGGSPAGMHVHDVDQVFYIVSGTMSIEVAGEAFEAGPGSLVHFPAGVPHRNWNAGREPTVHLAFQAPLPDPAVPFSRPA